ncbi:HET-domain-containing protein [Polyporus arcularius HHB13444]|uniref:HET-domain-containing protein n=1 Tax=Polyporus arcularius HHB13444 TaxID=1314778 RepID=A0A5C3PQ82_9APHY|nr:HET-domain-containing protein [Polyporus arcularius HHB13444]
MRLLHTKTGEFFDVPDPSKVHYAILSHVWSRAGEMSYQDVEHLRGQHIAHPSTPFLSNLSEKIRYACRLALVDGFCFIWIDTCCIDKTSSAELSEAINSMFQWYTSAAVCYVYLEDPEYAQEQSGGPSIAKCRWFTRGWTLQELIAPRILVFVGPDWIPFGSKDSYSDEIVSVTHIPEAILLHLSPVDSVDVATRMSWASERETTRVEDQAYCLMGIFGVYMPTIYGERSHAFRRLQEEILKRDPDHTILIDSSTTMSIDDPAWDWAYTARLMACTMTPGRRPRQPLADSPKSFRPSRSMSIHALSPDLLAQRLRMSSGHISLLPQISVAPDGVRLRMPIVHIGDSLVAGFLACEHIVHNSEPQLLVLLLCPPTRDAPCMGMDGLHYFIYGLYSVRAHPPVADLAFRNICLGLPEALYRYQQYSLPPAIPTVLSHTQGADYIPAECRLFLQKMHYGSYVLASCSVGREKCDKSWGYKFPLRTRTRVEHPHDCRRRSAIQRMSTSTLDPSLLWPLLELWFPRGLLRMSFPPGAEGSMTTAWRITPPLCVLLGTVSARSVSPSHSLPGGDTSMPVQSHSRRLILSLLTFPLQWAVLTYK